MKTKKPYVKEYDSNKVVVNQLTKEMPYLHEHAPSREMRRGHVRVIPIKIGAETIFVTQRKARSSKKWYNVS